MLDAFKNLIAELTGGETRAREFAESDFRLAAAAMLLHAAVIDGQIDPAERDLQHGLLKRRYRLGDDETARLIEAAAAAERESIDLYRFTRLLNRALDETGRLRIVKMMWQVAFADGQVTEFEENLIWRAADLLGVSSHDRIALRRRVARETRPDA